MKDLELEEINCPFCDIQNEDVFWEENSYKGRKCIQCGLLYISPRPTEQSMQNLYDREMAGGFSVQEHFQYFYSDHLLNKYIIRQIKKFKTSGNILEIGPGGGQFLRQAKSAGFNPSAIEINSKQAEFIQSNFNIPTEIGSPTDSSVFTDKKFDIIFQ